MRRGLMYLTITVLLWVLLCMSIGIAQVTRAGISIDEIVSQQYISGRVFGINPSEYGCYKIVVYVHTDKWYIHPYATGGEGRSYTTIRRDGSWRIGTVKREFPANQVAALILKRNYRPPATAENIWEINFVAITIRDTGYREGDRDWLL